MRTYQTDTRSFTTPKGNTAIVTYRLDTSDWNTVWSCLTEDEYGLRDLSVSGRAADIGAHIGGVTLALLADNPDVHVIAIEAVPENAQLLLTNLAHNGWTDRATVYNAAAGSEVGGTARIHFRYVGNETAEHHAFIGNIGMVVGFGVDHCPVDIIHEHADVPIITVGELGQLTFCKIDCEGGEWAFLDGDLSGIDRMHGEWHPTEGRTQADFSILMDGFDIAYTGPEAGPQGFTATRRV